MAPKPWPAPSVTQPVDADVTIPGSKSLTNRELVLSALATGPSTLSGGLRARDTDLMIEALRTLGARIETDRDTWCIRPIPKFDRAETPGRCALENEETTQPGESTIECGLAGTVMRFVPAIAALLDEPVRFVADEQANSRPIRPLYDALERLGIKIIYEGAANYPVTVQGPATCDGKLVVDSSESSQFLSALLLISPLLPGEGEFVEIELTGSLPSRPHIEMTLESLRGRGVEVDWVDDAHLRVKRGEIQPRDIAIEPDLSNAGPFLAAAIATGGHVLVPYWPLKTTQAGDAWREILSQMGQQVNLVPQGTQYGTLCLRGTEIGGFEGSMSQVGELVPTLAAICALATAPSRIKDIGHLRGHETDRLAAIATELKKLGVEVEEGADYLYINPANGWRDRLEGPVELHSYHDHRMATFGAIIGLAVPGIVVDDIETTSKTMPDFTKRWNQMLEGMKIVQA